MRGIAVLKKTRVPGLQLLADCLAFVFAVRSIGERAGRLLHTEEREMQKLLACAGIATSLYIVATPATALSKGDRSQATKPPGAARVETQAQCEARQQKIRDPVSGIRIQAGDAARFCNRQRSRR
jgi:hypothetical protein